MVREGPTSGASPRDRSVFPTPSAPLSAAAPDPAIKLGLPPVGWKGTEQGPRGVESGPRLWLASCWVCRSGEPGPQCRLALSVAVGLWWTG